MSDDDCTEALVIDNGTWMCRAGWAGDDSARAYCRPIIGEYDGRKCFDYEAITKPSTNHCPMDRGVITDWDDMEEFWSFIFDKELRLAKQCHLPMLITEVPHNPKGNRETMGQILMEKFDVTSLCFYDPAALALFASGRTTGIVLDVGHGVTHTSALFDGYQIKEATRRIDLGGYDVNKQLIQNLLNLGYCYSTHKEMQQVDNLKQDFNLWYMFGEHVGANQSDQNQQNYKLPDGKVLSEKELAKCAKCHEVLFEPIVAGISLPGLHEILNESIQACPVDIRRDLYLNIALSGGTTMCRGLTEYLDKRLRLLLNRSSVPLRVVAPPERRKSSWIGGSIVASLSGFGNQCIKKQDYYEHGPSIFHTERAFATDTE